MGTTLMHLAVSPECVHESFLRDRQYSMLSRVFAVFTLGVLYGMLSCETHKHISQCHTKNY